MAIKLALLATTLSVFAFSSDIPNVRRHQVSHAWSLEAAKAGNVSVVDLMSDIAGVVIEPPRVAPSTPTGASLEQKDLAGLIEKDLRDRGVPLRPDDWMKQTPPKRYAALSVAVSVASEGNTIAYNVSLSLFEDLARQSKQDILVHAPIWECHALCITDSSQLHTDVLRTIHDVVADFCKAFAAAH